MDQLSLFSAERLPHKPWCTDDKESGLYVRPLSKALLRRFLQFNPPNALYWIVIDIDAPIALDNREVPSTQMLAILNGQVPAPNFLVANPANGHAHGFYALETAVAKGEHASHKALRYASAIEAALIRALGGDALYAGVVAKNPHHPDWRLWKLRNEPYTLAELHDSLDLRGPSKSKLRKEAIGQGLGRNCDLFDKLRYHAYRHVEMYKADATESQWHRYCQAKAQDYNDFCPPLDANEVKHIAKSVAKWTWQHYTGQMSDKAFSKKQAFRGAKGGRISAKARAGGGNLSDKMKAIRACSPKNEDAIRQANELQAQGYAVTAIAAQLSVSRATIYKWLKDNDYLSRSVK